MPRFIGNSARSESVRIEDNAFPLRGELVKISFAQQRLLPADQVRYSLDTSDRGGRGSYAKRWYRWFASPQAILDCGESTSRMREKAFASLARAAKSA